MTGKSCFRASFSKAARKARTALAAAFLCAAGHAPLLYAAEEPSPPPTPHAETTPVPVQHKKSALRELYEANGGTYAAELSGAETSEAELRKAFLAQFCTTAGTSVPPGHPNQVLMESLGGLEKISGIGDVLFKSAQAGGVQFCALQAVPADVAAQYMSEINAVVAGTGNRSPSLRMTLAHEILHSIQGQRGVLQYQYSWDMERRVSRSLAIEAAAMTTEFLVAWQAAQQGDPTYWKSLQKVSNFSYADQEMYKTIEDSWNKAKLAGASPDEALRQAGAAAWRRVFSNDEFLNFYLNREILRLLENIQSGQITPAAGFVTVKMEQGNEVGLSGAVSDAFNFTAGEKMPSFAELLARNQKMKWAAEAVSILQYEKVFGKTSPEAQSQRDNAVAGGNPYLALNLENIPVRVQPLPQKKIGSISVYFYQTLDAELARQSTPAPAATEPTSVPPPSPPSSPATPAP